eukprot:COSAG02_NODE_4086_length_5806_cov_8.073243_4_plen_81_part_00
MDALNGPCPRLESRVVFIIVGTRYPGDHVVLIAEEFPHYRSVRRIGNAWAALAPPQNQRTAKASRRTAAMAAAMAMSHRP